MLAFTIGSKKEDSWVPANNKAPSCNYCDFATAKYHSSVTPSSWCSLTMQHVYYLLGLVDSSANLALMSASLLLLGIVPSNRMI